MAHPIFVLTVFSMVSALLLGCGGGGDLEAGSCEAANTEVCDQACACSTDETCKILSGGVTITHDNRSDCLGFWVQFGCSQDQGTIDFEACETALDSATCVGTGEDMALEFPSECGDES